MEHPSSITEFSCCLQKKSTTSLMHRAVGVLMVLRTPSGVLVGERNSRIAWQGLYHVAPSARMQPSKTTHDTRAAMEIALENELGLLTEDVQGLTEIGATRDHTTQNQEISIVFTARTRLKLEEIEDRANGAAMRKKHAVLRTIPWDPTQLHSFLLRNEHTFVPSGWAALVLALRAIYGPHSFPVNWRVIHQPYAQWMTLATHS